MTKHWLAALVLAATILQISSAQAATVCAKFNTLPAAEEGRLGYDLTTHNYYVCNGTSWVVAW